MQDEGAGSEQGGDKDREVYGGEQDDRESGKEVNFYFRVLTPFFAARGFDQGYYHIES